MLSSSATIKIETAVAAGPVDTGVAFSILVWIVPLVFLAQDVLQMCSLCSSCGTSSTIGPCRSSSAFQWRWLTAPSFLVGKGPSSLQFLKRLRQRYLIRHTATFRVGVTPFALLTAVSTPPPSWRWRALYRLRSMTVTARVVLPLIEFSLALTLVPTQTLTQLLSSPTGFATTQREVKSIKSPLGTCDINREVEEKIEGILLEEKKATSPHGDIPSFPALLELSFAMLLPPLFCQSSNSKPTNAMLASSELPQESKNIEIAADSVEVAVEDTAESPVAETLDSAMDDKNVEATAYGDGTGIPPYEELDGLPSYAEFANGVPPESLFEKRVSEVEYAIRPPPLALYVSRTQVKPKGTRVSQRHLLARLSSRIVANVDDCKRHSILVHSPTRPFPPSLRPRPRNGWETSRRIGDAWLGRRHTSPSQPRTASATRHGRTSFGPAVSRFCSEVFKGRRSERRVGVREGNSAWASRFFSFPSLSVPTMYLLPVLEAWIARMIIRGDEI
ncbi:hypothetical protein MSAN_00319400 [Mycena sanguinolenta]|uniref:Uncharacterized protein n=1 Tax=Mycena sanguinolenta TaxID=230812 RepID=A0A8H6ZB97_9AGAR|nr:hypothetical protein MSAN_00319400 [Mycena sanguinolenta]